VADLFDPETVVEALTGTLTAAGINVQAEVTGRLVPPCVQLYPPALRIDDSGEGFDVPESRWRLICWYSGAAGRLDTVGEAQFAMSVMAALRAPTVLPTEHFVSWLPGETAEPSLEPVGSDTENDQRHLFRREIPLTVNHT
jgi:hypothetical protein